MTKRKTRFEMDLTRRRLVQGLAAGAALLQIPAVLMPARAAQPTALDGAPELRGTEFDLVIAETAVNITGRARVATTINGSLPAPTLRWRLGDTVTIRVTNRLRVDTSIHWHGILLPYQMDGVPGISFKGIAPGETYTYRFKITQTGTYWYHSHSGFQEQTGMYGAIVIDGAEQDRRATRDYVVHLSDWTDDDPLSLLSTLKKQSDYYNFNQPTVPEFIRDIFQEGFTAAWQRRAMGNEMSMSPTDLADVSAHAYTYLMNGVAAAGNWTALFQPGERVRLRLIGAAALTFFDVRIPGLPMTVIHVDGQDIEPVTVDELRIAPGETYDVVVAPKDDAYTLFAQSMDRSGYVRGTLAARPGLTAPVPPLDTPQWLTMGDMMGMMTSHAGHAMHDGAGGTEARHARSEFGASVDMRVDQPRTNLDDPGVGLRDNGRRVLTYADIRTPGGPLDPRAPTRDIELHLTGNMERYLWSIDGVEFSRSTPVHFRHGERLRVILHNDTMMSHPMHLHGMWSELLTPAGEFLARRHTYVLQPAQRITALVNADALGRWAWHCHLAFHMDAGMFREVVVA